MFHAIPVVVLIALSSLALAGATQPPATSALDSAEFARLKSLAGTWMLADEAGKPTKDVGSVFEIVAMGHSIRETMFPGTPEEMVNMYYRNGTATEMVHYCAAGNQPRLDIRSAGPNVLSLAFIDATNLGSLETEHMHSAKFILQGENKLRTEWLGWKNGKPSDTTVFNLIRQP